MGKLGMDMAAMSDGKAGLDLERKIKNEADEGGVTPVSTANNAGALTAGGAGVAMASGAATAMVNTSDGKNLAATTTAATVRDEASAKHEFRLTDDDGDEEMRTDTPTEDEPGAAVSDTSSGLTADAADLAALGEEFGKIKYLESESNLQLPALNAESIDEDAPFDSFKAAGKWLKEAANLENYWQAVQRFGEEFANYKWAYDEGKMGDFNAKDFAKEAGKAGLRSIGSDVLRTSGNLMTMFGANLTNGSAITTAMTAGAGAVLPKAGEEIVKLGKALRAYADEVENLSFWAPSEAVYSEDPSWSKLANIVGSGSSQVLAMGLTAKLMGAGTAYGLFAGGAAGEMFNEAYAQNGDTDKANALAAANAGITFAIDKLFNPLPEMVQKNAKTTSKMIAKEFFGAPLREAGSEALQQMLAENLVRKVGIDDTQDLFEGLIESALGAFAGSSMLTTAGGGAYYARQTYDNARRRIMLKGVSKEELDLYQKNMQQLLLSKPEVFDKILSYNLKENLRAMDAAARQEKNRKARQVKREDVKEFQGVFDQMYERFLPVLGDKSKARAAAGIFEAGAMSLYARDSRMTPARLVDGMLPKLEKTDVATFLRQALSENNVSFQIIGSGAKKANHEMEARALDLEKKGVDLQRIWQLTGWTRGADGMMHSEISDAKARIKLWDDDTNEQLAAEYMRQERNNLEGMRAYLAAGLDSSANGIYGDYYQAFIKYLDQTPGETSWYEDGRLDDPWESKLEAFDIIDPETAIDRENESLYLGILARSLTHIQGKDGQTEFWQKLKDDYLKDVTAYLTDGKDQARFDEMARDTAAHLSQFDAENYGKTYRDFNEQESRVIMSILERRRFEDFKNRFWNPNTGPNKLFLELAAEKEAEYGQRKDYTDLMDRITREMQQRRDERSQAIAEKGIQPYRQLFQDIDLEEAYRRYAAYAGDFSGEIADMDYRTDSYQKAFLPRTSSERFLEQEPYAFLNEIEKRKLLEHLDRVELLYRVDKHLAHAAAYEKKTAAARTRYAAHQLENGEMSPQAAQRWQARLKLKNGMEMPLGVLLEHQELYDNYPTLAEARVRFAKLKDGEPYHFYHDREKGYVLELDADMLYHANLKETLLAGTAFIIQDMEGFDYTLTDKQRHNYMDRQLYYAKQEVADQAIAELTDFVHMALPGVNPAIFVVKREMPVTLAGVAESRAADNEGMFSDAVRFKEVDYDKLKEAVLTKYRNIFSDEGTYMRNYIYANMQRLKSENMMRVMAAARKNGGYRSAGLPWSGITAQGAMEARAVSNRMELSSEDLRQQPYFDNNADLRFYRPDTMDAYDEFERRVKEDRKNYQETLEKLARGAYDSASRTIYLFENADVETIVHETFHSFWDMMEQADNRNESHGASFQTVMNDLREDLLRHYRIQRMEDGYYIIDKENGEALEELPIAFQTSSAALDAGVRELFVSRFMALFNGKTKVSDSGTIADAADFYRKWLSTLAAKLEITEEKASSDGKGLLRFLKKKIQ